MNKVRLLKTQILDISNSFKSRTRYSIKDVNTLILKERIVTGFLGRLHIYSDMYLSVITP